MPKIFFFLGLIGIASFAHGAEEYACKQTECRVAGRDCHKEGIEDDPFLQITINTDAGKTHIKKCRKKTCDMIPVERVEIRGLCRRRGNHRLLENDPDYCGDYIKFYNFETQSDLQIFPESDLSYITPGYMIYNNGYGIQLLGTCKKSNPP